jgi:hypothetical protein
MRKLQFRYLLLALLSLCVPQFAWVQTSTATLSGIVRDAQGGIIPDASISVVQIETGLTRAVASGHTGDYSISNLPIGTYRITASAQGFKKTVIGRNALASRSFPQER